MSLNKHSATIAIAATAFFLCLGSAAHAAPGGTNCGASDAAAQADNRSAWLAQRPAHPQSQAAQKAFGSGDCVSAEATAAAERSNRLAEGLADGRTGWLAMQTAHPLSDSVRGAIGR